MEGDLKELFEDLEDSRQDWKIKHSLYEILMVVFCGVSAGETSINGILAFARCKKQWLMDKANLTFPNGLPSYDTIRRMLGALDSKQFQKVMIRFMERTLNIPKGSYVSIDGKTLRGSGYKEDGIEPLHLLHAYSHECGLVIGQLECHKDKTNEIPVSKELLDLLKLKDTIITADAMMCQKDVIEKMSKNNDYVVALKGNQKTMFEEVKELFECPTDKTRKTMITKEKSRGRFEIREYTLETNIDWFQDKKDWKNLKAFIMCKSTVISKNKERTEKRYFITSLEDITKASLGIRNHWAIENNLHWSLDVIFKDDECRVLDRNASENLAIMRRIIYNRIKMLSHLDKLIDGKRYCTYDDDFRAKILFSC